MRQRQESDVRSKPKGDEAKGRHCSDGEGVILQRAHHVSQDIADDRVDEERDELGQ